MNKRIRKKHLVLGLFIMISIIVIIDIFLFRKLFDLKSIYLSYLMSLIVLVINALIMGYVIFKLKSIKNDKVLSKSLLEIVDEFGYAIPINESGTDEVEIDEVPSEHTPDSNSISYDENLYQKPKDLDEYLDNLNKYMSDKGIGIDKNSLREIFAGMAASKLVIIKHKDLTIAEKTTKLFFEYIGANYVVDNISEKTQDFKCLFQSKYQFSDVIDNAEKKRNTINIMSLKNIDIKDFDIHFNPITEYALNPLLPVYIENDHFEDIKQLPANIWFMIILDSNDLQRYSNRLAQAAITIELNSLNVESNNEVNENLTKLSFDIFNELLFEGYDLYFMEEWFWKNIDEIEMYCNVYTPFSIDNRLFRQLERYTSAFLIYGGEKTDAIDSVLFGKLLNVISLLRLSNINEEKVDIVLVFDKLFGLENLSKSKKILKEIQEFSE